MDAGRRKFLASLRGTGVALAASVVSRHAWAQDGSSFGVVELRDGLSLVTGAGCNVVVLPGAQSVLAVDSGTPERGDALRRFLERTFGAVPVEVLFNTHWHLDHTGGNEALGRSAAAVVAHESTRLWMTTKFYVDWEERYYVPRPPAARPNRTFFSHEAQPLTLAFGGETIAYGHLPEAHTDGDLYVRFPQRNVIVAGGAVSSGRYPVLDYITGGWIGGLEEATKRLLELADDRTLIVPDRGPPLGRADLEAQYHMVSTVRRRIEERALEGQGIDEMLTAGLTREFDERFGADSALFIANAYHGMWQGRLRGTVA